MNILQEIASRTKERVEEQKKLLPLRKLIETHTQENHSGFPFEKALRTNDIAFICEIKKASPSKGIIAEHFPYLEIAKEWRARRPYPF